MYGSITLPCDRRPRQQRRWTNTKVYILHVPRQSDAAATEETVYGDEDTDGDKGGVGGDGNEWRRGAEIK